MVTIRSTNDIVLGLLDFFKAAQPNLDTKPGTVARDLFIDAPASITALLYDELGKISNLQSLTLVSGTNLDRLAQNFGATRKAATPSTGVALLTFSSIPAVVGVSQGSIITATNGATFSVVNGISVNPTQSNYYKSIAIKYQANLSFVGITDQYAVEVTVTATNPGSAGNIGQYTLNTTTIAGVSNVTNAFPFTGGTDQEDDATFRNRVLAIFSGSNIGTALGYQNVALSVTGVSSAYVVTSGNPLMTRDGTIVQTINGVPTIISDGTGGKIDIYILGNSLTSFIDTYIYQDQSNLNDPTNAANIIVLGQIPADAGLTITQKRLNDIASGTLPAQPVINITQVTGSVSGTNFVEKTVDVYGRISGNYELIKDTGFYAGSPWGMDEFHWVSNQITDFPDNIVKGQFNGQDQTTFTSVLEIPTATQNISITNENSLVSTTDNSMIQLLHYPATNVTRVYNTNTGEQYTIINQNVDGTSSVNDTGIIQISGNTLPSTSNILQVDYTWIVSYDGYSDYDGKLLNNNPRPSVNSIDWGIANAIRYERVLLTLNSNNTVFNGTTSLPISSVISANMFASTHGITSASIVPNFTDNIAIVITNLPAPINSIESVHLSNTYEELYNTAEANGEILNTTVVLGTQLAYNATIILPTDTQAIIGEFVTITYNQVDTFNIVNSTGSFILNQLTIPIGNIPVATAQLYVDITYIAATQDVIISGITGLPISRSGNGFFLNTNTGSLNAIKSDTIKRETQTVQENSSNQFFVNLDITSTYYNLIVSQVITVVDQVSQEEIWNYDYPGTITTNSSGNYQLIFSGYNSPKVGDNVLVVYFATDINDAQPFTYNNNIIKKDFQTLLFNSSTNMFYVPIHNNVVESGMTFNVIDTTTGLSIGDGYDGYISVVNTNGTATFSSFTFDFANITDLTGKLLQINKPTSVNNAGNYNIEAYNANTNTLTIAVEYTNLNPYQISIIRLVDNKDLWSVSTCTLDTVANLLELPATTLASQGDDVIVLLFTNQNLHQAPTRLSVTVADQTINTGIIAISGTTITQVANVVFLATQNGLQQNLLSAMKTFLNLTSNGTIAANNYLIRVVGVQQVSITTGNVILSSVATYDVQGTQVANNLLYADEMVYNGNLGNFDFILPNTQNNINNSPTIGDALLITFYYATDNNYENLYFTRNGTLYTDNKFAFIEQIYVSSGFNSSLSARLTFSYFTQPATGSRYIAYYNYLAPQQNERILITYNYNQLVTNATFAVETQRPIDADVLVKAAIELLIDVTMNIIVTATYTSSSAIVAQNVQNVITTTINTNQLGGIISSSQLIAAAQGVAGVESAIIIGFNIDGQAGQVILITAQDNQYFVANTITINITTNG
jgi:uncharacterized phage protein gp47/JayE